MYKILGLDFIVWDALILWLSLDSLECKKLVICAEQDLEQNLGLSVILPQLKQYVIIFPSINKQEPDSIFPS